eukprot:TRINITY_DN10672_c0_g1_i1.p1 TRINITY_DN10672_c0_g1~~TRINITY_DN10672_c0_g1_i1.p1  ORF type:complete len:507 (-),score=142.51 TRINITY_DN10672_c0_g1_i1:162-1682(-)
MIEGDTILSAIYAVINLFIPVLFGFMLAKLGALTPTNRKVLSDVCYYCVTPIYSIYFIMQAVDKDRLTDLAIIFWAAIPCIVVTFAIMLIIAFVLGLDIRITFSYCFVHVYGNVVIMPQMLADSLCERGAKYEETETCQNNLVKPYSSVPLIYMNILYWVTVLPMLQEERRIALVTKKATLVVLNFYETVDDFLADTKTFEAAKFMAARVLKDELNGHADEHNVQISHPDVRSSKGIPVSPLEADDPAQTQSELPKLVCAENKRFIDEYYQKSLTRARFNDITAGYAAFEEKFFSQPENVEVRKLIEKEVLEPEKLMTLPKEESLKDPYFYVNHILCSPPAICSIIGLILGFIFPFTEWLFDPDHTPLPTFLSTFQTMGGMLSPISLFLLGTYLSQTAVIRRDMFLGWKHVIISNVVKNLIIPAFGLLWVTVIMKETVGSSYDDNPILIFMSYTYWIVPNGILLIAVYVVADYFAMEFAVLSVYMNIIAIPMMIVFMIFYFLIYEG